MIDFRSDTLTLPTQEILNCIDLNKLGDASREDIHERGEDRHVTELEDEVSARFGFGSSLFFHNGTSANICMVKAVCGRGSWIIVDENSHIFQSETALFDEEYYGMAPLTMDTFHHGTFKEKLEHVLSTSNVKLLCLEVPNAFYSGAVIPEDGLKQLYELCQEHEVHLHIDGARIFNAMANGYMENAFLGNYCDSMMLSFSKGLGSPMGGILCGSEASIHLARQVRKKNGMHMRQGGVIAAAALAALENMGQLKIDNQMAEKIQKALVVLEGVKVETVKTCINIVQFTSEIYTNDELRECLAEQGILLNEKRGLLRLYTHKHITESEVQTFINAIATLHSQ